MRSDLSCNTVKDLLPIYLDGIASEETNTCVKKHLSECELCLSEYKRLCEITQKNGEVVMNETASIKILKKTIITWFITVIVLGILLISIAMFCYYFEYGQKHFTILELIGLIAYYAVIYLIPLFGVFVGVIWKKTINKREKMFWPNGIILFLGTWVLSVVVLLVWHLFLVIRVISQ